MDTQTPQSGPTNLLAENLSLRQRVTCLEQMVKNLIEKNNDLGEFIRQQMSAMLQITEKFRDEYSRYAEFVSTMTQQEVQQHTGDTDDEGEELSV